MYNCIYAKLLKVLKHTYLLYFMYLHYRLFFLFMFSLAQKSVYKPKIIYKRIYAYISIACPRMCVCIHTYLCVYIQAYLCTHRYICVYICIFKHTQVYLCIWISMQSIYKYTSTHPQIYVCMYTHWCTHAQMHTCVYIPLSVPHVYPSAWTRWAAGRSPTTCLMFKALQVPPHTTQGSTAAPGRHVSKSP